MPRKVGRGLIPSPPSKAVGAITPERQRELARESRALAIAKKEARAEKFEERMSEQLDAVAHLLSMTTALASDPDVILSPAQMQKMQLGIKSAQVILDRALGKAVSRVEGKVTHNVVSEMLKTDEEWVVEDVEAIEDEP